MLLYTKVFVTYPQDMKEDEDIFLILLEKTKDSIKATKKNPK